jgi:hypothetical protein
MNKWFEAGAILATIASFLIIAYSVSEQTLSNAMLGQLNIVSLNIQIQAFPANVTNSAIFDKLYDDLYWRSSLLSDVANGAAFWGNVFFYSSFIFGVIALYCVYRGFGDTKKSEKHG